MINDGTPMIQCSSCTELVVSYGLLCCAFTVHDKQMTTMEMPVLHVQSNKTVHSLSYMHVHAADPH